MNRKIQKHESEKKKSKTLKLRTYCILTVLLSLFITGLIYFHAGVALFNVFIFILFIFYFKRIYSKNARKIIKISYMMIIMSCNIISILMSFTIILSLIGSIGKEYFFDILQTL